MADLTRRGFFGRMALGAAGLWLPKVLPVDVLTWAPLAPVPAGVTAVGLMLTRFDVLCEGDRS